MQATDFLYDGVYLSDFGFVVCDFNFSGDVTGVSGGSEISFNKVAHKSGRRYSLSSTKYTDTVTTTFDICKDPAKYTEKEMGISDVEYREIFRWLNRTGFHKMKFINNCDADEEYQCYYNASFNITKLSVGGSLYGIRLKMETDSPYGHGAKYEKKFTNVSASSGTLSVDFVTDEIGRDYADITFKCRSAGNMTIANTTTGETAVIKNCANGETVTIDGETLQISSDAVAHDIANDFSYTFLSLENSMRNTKNLFTVSLPCDITIGYTPVVKLTL